MNFQVDDIVQIKPNVLGERFDGLYGVVTKIRTVYFPFEEREVTYVNVRFEQEFYEEELLPKTFHKNELALQPNWIVLMLRRYIPCEFDQEAVMGNAELLADLDITPEEIRELTAHWTPEFKKAVWAVLNPETKTHLKQLLTTKKS